jgi:hypothetical protein
MASIDPTFVLSNRIEAAFWGAIAVTMVVAAVRKTGTVRMDCAIAAVTFAIFGLSDLVETRTGAWWRPWWLLVWKGVCVLIFLALFVRYARRRRANPQTAAGGSSTSSRQSGQGQNPCPPDRC